VGTIGRRLRVTVEQQVELTRDYLRRSASRIQIQVSIRRRLACATSPSMTQKADRRWVLDVGDTPTQACVLDEAGEVIEESRVADHASRLTCSGPVQVDGGSIVSPHD
jgi:hypothetical protein